MPASMLQQGGALMLLKVAETHTKLSKRPENQDPSVVAVPRWPMMHAVVERGVEHVLQGPQPAAKLCMNPELIEHIELRMYPVDRSGTLNVSRFECISSLCDHLAKLVFRPSARTNLGEPIKTNSTCQRMFRPESLTVCSIPIC